MSDPVPGAPSRAADWRRRVHEIFLERLGLKLTATALSLLLWFVVSAREPTESYVSVNIVTGLDSARVLLGDPPAMRALVAGRASAVAQLIATPPVIIRPVSGIATDSLVVDVAPGDVRIPMELKSEIRVLDVEPRRVTLRFARRAAAAVAP